MARILLIRHGESVHGSERRYAGHLDSPLTPKGRRQISRLCRRFKTLGATRIFASDLRRCRETARLLAPGSEITTSKALREMHFGVWEGKTARQCLRSHRRRFECWMQDPVSVTPPQGESLAALSRRVRSYVTRMVRRHPRETLAFVTHGGAIRTLLTQSPEDFWSVNVPTGALIEHEWKGSRR